MRGGGGRGSPKVYPYQKGACMALIRSIMATFHINLKRIISKYIFVMSHAIF